MNGQEDKEKEILVTRSSLPSYEEYIEMIKPIWDSAWLTNMGDFHKQLEKELKEYMGCLLYTSFWSVAAEDTPSVPAVPAAASVLPAAVPAPSACSAGTALAGATA